MDTISNMIDVPGNNLYIDMNSDCRTIKMFNGSTCSKKIKLN